MILISLDNLYKNLNTAKSWLKSLNLKKLDQEKKSLSQLSRKSWHLKKVGLDTKDSLYLDLLWPPGLHFLTFFERFY
jgi:hypothetical protein